MKKKLIAILLCSIMVLSGCSSSEKSTESNLKDFDIVLDWYPNAIHAFIYTAIENGYYAEEGLNVNIQFPSNANDALSLTAAGKADMGIYYMHDVIMAKANQDVPIVSVGAVSQEPLDVFMSLKEKNISGPEDFAGKTIGECGTELSPVFINEVIKHVGGNPDETEIINVGFDLMSSMTTGNVDATYGCVVNHEVPQMEEAGFEVNYFFPSDYGIPEYYGYVLVTGEKQIKEDKEKIDAFIRASIKGFEDMKNNPEKSLEILLDHQNEENFPLSKTVEEKSMEILIPKMENVNVPFLTQTEAKWQENIDWLVEKGLMEEGITAKDIIYGEY